MKEIHYDSRIDQYIAKAQPFARPILKHVRTVVHEVCPEVTETIRWGMPHFEYKGMLGSMAAFKQHAVFGLWKSKLIPEVQRLGLKENAMGSMGRLTSLKDLPSDASLKKMIRQAMRLNEQGIKLERAPRKPKQKLVLPKDFARALDRQPEVEKVFQILSYSHKKEYIEWITEAKREDTRQRRIESALDMLAEQKARHWKYKK